MSLDSTTAGSGGALSSYIHVRIPGQASGFVPAGCDPGNQCAL